MSGRALALLVACLVGAGTARAEAPPTLPLVWSQQIEPDAGSEFTFIRTLAVHADGTALVALVQRAKGDNKARERLVLISIGTAGRPLGRISPAQDFAKVDSVALAADADGFAVAASVDEDVTIVFRLARDGSVQAVQRPQFGRSALDHVQGLAADGRGNLLLHGGWGLGPVAPALAGLDRSGRVVWMWTGRTPMPPGGAPTARFRRDGGADAVVIDREKPSWERRSARGALLMRSALPRHWNCWSFLDERALATVLFNWRENPSLPTAPPQRWLLALIGSNGRFRPGHVVLDLPGDQNANCHLATADEGWIAVAVDDSRIATFDRALARRAEIDVSAAGAKSIDALAIDGLGAVTLLADATGRSEPGPKLMLLRFAPVAP